MSRFLVRYRFTKKSPMISGTDIGRTAGVYRDADTVEQAFEEEREMWLCWNADIEFIEGRKIR